MLLPVFLVTLFFVAFIFAGVGIRMFLVKDGEFRGTCAQRNPMLQQEIGHCTVCGKSPEEACKKSDVAA